jgi:hypothetical protein
MYGAQSRSHPCLSSYQDRRCSCTSTRRNTCAREMGGGTRWGGRRYNREERRRGQHYLRLIPVHCASAIASASCSSLAGISGFSRRPLSLAIPESSSPICMPAVPFLHVNVPGAPSPALPHRLPWRDHPLPACACAHGIALMRSTTRQKLVKRLVSHRCPSVAHRAHGTHVLTCLLFQLFLSMLRRLCAFLGRPRESEGRGRETRWHGMQ